MTFWLLTGFTFLLVGLVKGVIGMGLPTVAMAVLSLAVPPVEAAALLVVPSLVTNVWQLLAGPGFGALLRRLWPMMAAIVAGTLAGAGLLADDTAGSASLALGGALAVYAVVGLAGLKSAVARHHEAWLGPLVGLATGLVAGGTGVFVIPAVPYLQAIGLEKDDLIQALGLSFTVSTLALAAGLLRVDAYHANALGLSALALVPALAGLWLGQSLRRHMAAATFRTVFFAGLLVLGVYLTLREIA